MPAPTIRGTATAPQNTASTTLPTLTIPVAAITGDYCQWFATVNLTSTVTQPSGFGLIASGNVNNNNFLYVYDKVLTTGDISGTTLPAASSVAAVGTVTCVVYNGATGLDALSTVTTAAGASTAVTIPAVTPSSGDCLVVYVVSTSASVINTSVGLSAIPSGFTADIDNSTSAPAGSFWRGHAIGHQALTGQAGAPQGPFSATEVTTTRDVQLSMTIAPVTVAPAFTYNYDVRIG